MLTAQIHFEIPSSTVDPFLERKATSFYQVSSSESHKSADILTVSSPVELYASTPLGDGAKMMGSISEAQKQKQKPKHNKKKSPQNFGQKSYDSL